MPQTGSIPVQKKKINTTDMMQCFVIAGGGFFNIHSTFVVCISEMKSTLTHQCIYSRVHQCSQLKPNRQRVFFSQDKFGRAFSPPPPPPPQISMCGGRSVFLPHKMQVGLLQSKLLQVRMEYETRSVFLSAHFNACVQFAHKAKSTNSRHFGEFLQSKY